MGAPWYTTSGLKSNRERPHLSAASVQTMICSTLHGGGKAFTAPFSASYVFAFPPKGRLFKFTERDASNDLSDSVEV